jgi:hypothetical protein
MSVDNCMAARAREVLSYCKMWTEGDLETLHLRPERKVLEHRIRVISEAMQMLDALPPDVRCTSWLGATVRLRKGKRTAIVESDNVRIGNSQVEGGVRLDKPLGGFRYWNIEDLTMVAPNNQVNLCQPQTQS